MPWLVALTLAFGVVAAAASASAAVYVPGHIRDGVYTHPHFLDSPAVRYDREIKLESGIKRGSEQDKLSKPAIIDEPLPAQKLPPETSS